jgi:hypothetical protein
MQIPLNNLFAPASVFSVDGRFIVASYGASELRVYPRPRDIKDWLAVPDNYHRLFTETAVEQWNKDYATEESRQ